jgi:ribosome-associated protein
MDIRKLQRAIVDGLEDVKAQNIVVFNTEHLSPLFERVIIASGTSNRQTKALASSVRDSVKKRGMQVMRTEGEDNGEWIIVDCGAAVAHIMQPAIREYYHLEEIWGGKPVKLKLDGEVKGLVKASSPDDEDDEPAPAAKKVAAKKSATAKTAAGKVATKTAAPKAAPAKAPAKAPSKKAPARKAAAPAKAPAKKTAAKKPAVTRTVGVKSAAAKTPARKAPAKKAPARKASAR